MSRAKGLLERPKSEAHRTQCRQQIFSLKDEIANQEEVITELKNDEENQEKELEQIKSTVDHSMEDSDVFTQGVASMELDIKTKTDIIREHEECIHFIDVDIVRAMEAIEEHLEQQRWRHADEVSKLRDEVEMKERIVCEIKEKRLNDVQESLPPSQHTTQHDGSRCECSVQIAQMKQEIDFQMGFVKELNSIISKYNISGERCGTDMVVKNVARSSETLRDLADNNNYEENLFLKPSRQQIGRITHTTATNDSQQNKFNDEPRASFMENGNLHQSSNKLAVWKSSNSTKSNSYSIDSLVEGVRMRGDHAAMLTDDIEPQLSTLDETEAVQVLKRELVDTYLQVDECKDEVRKQCFVNNELQQQIVEVVGDMRVYSEQCDHLGQQLHQRDEQINKQTILIEKLKRKISSLQGDDFVFGGGVKKWASTVGGLPPPPPTTDNTNEHVYLYSSPHHRSSRKGSREGGLRTRNSSTSK